MTCLGVRLVLRIISMLMLIRRKLRTGASSVKIVNQRLGSKHRLFGDLNTERVHNR
jgi:hypothetical protein